MWLSKISGFVLFSELFRLRDTALESIVGSNEDTTIYSFENKWQDMQLKPEKSIFHTINLQKFLLIEINLICNVMVTICESTNGLITKLIIDISPSKQRQIH